MNKLADAPATDYVSFRVNGTPVRLACAPAKTLAYVLREDLGLTGTKTGCDAGDCGACTVLLGGKQVCACLTAVGSCEGSEVQTVEGLGTSGALSALQFAFLRHGAAQCGICTPGMLMAAQAVLAANPRPSEEEVLDGLGGVLCRCTGYRKIAEAVMDAVSATLLTPPPDSGHAVGARLQRLDGVSKLTGTEFFGADRFPENSLWLRVIRSPHARARFALGDLGAFKRRYPAVEEIITAADVPENSFAVFAQPKDQPVLADGHVRFRGEAVLGLIGEREALARIPESEVPIQWQVLKPLLSTEEALAASDDLVHEFAAENVLCRGRVVKGDVDQALATAQYAARGEFRSAYVEHAYIEPEAGYAEMVGDRIRIFACTQTPYMDKEEVARILNIAPDKVHIVPSAIGGGFGGKLDLSVQPLLAVACWKTRRPVRMVYTRPESMMSTTKRHPSHIHATLACDEKGMLLAVDFS
ncbi:MAG: molybdopterin cofactor-binding domain-containing protein, partial [Burkholderiales bacterium]